MTFSCGDFVQLRTGGHAMVVSARATTADGEDGWRCWWAVNYAVRQEVVHEVILCLYNPDPKKMTDAELEVRLAVLRQINRNDTPSLDDGELS
jgi:uncharacterized protein YodC (DUF2158 family)